MNALLIILGTFGALLFLWVGVINPLLDWLVDLGEQRVRTEARRRRLDAVVRANDRRPRL